MGAVSSIPVKTHNMATQLEFQKIQKIPISNMTSRERLVKQQEKFSFLLPDHMKVLGFDCLKDGEKDGYYKYENDGTKHRNKDYNQKYPEGKGKVVISLNINYTGTGFCNLPNIGIKQDGGTRSSYNGVIPSEKFFVMLLNSIR